MGADRFFAWLSTVFDTEIRDKKHFDSNVVIEQT